VEGVFCVAFCLELVLGVADLSFGLVLLLEFIRLVSSEGVQFSGGVFILFLGRVCRFWSVILCRFGSFRPFKPSLL